ncbi:MAG: MFS transporter [Planctomycetes bacterium]|nr:MFS transporter [Planctomycetota bacterium]
MSSTTRVLVLMIAAVGFLFDTYELLMFPVIGSNAIAELQYKKGYTSLSEAEINGVRTWGGRMLWIAALTGGGCGLLGGLLIDRLGRKTIMVASIFVYSFSPVAAAFSSELWQLILFRCTTFIGVCVEMVAAVTWLAELFEDKRTRELVIGWTLATASLGGIFVTLAYNSIVSAQANQYLPEMPFPKGHMTNNVAWRFTLLTGLIPGALILFLMPFVPESGVWKKKKQEGTLKRPSFGELFSPQLRLTTLVTTILSACGYAAAFGAIQMTPLQVASGLPDMVAMIPEPVKKAQGKVRKTAADSPEREAAVKDLIAARKANETELKAADQALSARRGNIQLWQELGGLLGRILLAVLLLFVPSRTLIRLFLIPGVILFPLTFFGLVKSDYWLFAAAIFFCGLLTVAQFSFLSEFLPRVFPMHLRGTGGSFATNLGGRMIGTMAATLNTELLAPMFRGEGTSPPIEVAMAAGVIGGAAYLVALIASFFLPHPHEEVEKQVATFGRDEALNEPKAETVD